MIQPSNWSQAPTRAKGKTSKSGVEEIRRSVIATNAANHAMAAGNMPGIRKL